jgi:adenine-specific DNA methylase
MNFKALESEQKLRGGYYTQPDIALFLTRWVLEGRPRAILEPSCGDGAFIQAVADLAPSGLRELVACELLAVEAKKAQERAVAAKGVKISIHIDDFLRWSLPRLSSPPQFGGALGNPPFIRYQYLEPEMQARAQEVFEHFGLPFTKHTNAWVPFVIASLALLQPAGRLAMVVPAEILHLLHARPLRHFLLSECSKVLVLDPRDIWFSETLQGVVLLLAEKRPSPGREVARIAVVPLRGRSTLNGKASKYFAESAYLPGDTMNGKWMLALLSEDERNLLSRLSEHRQVRPFREVASVDVGIVTGANKFFLVPDSVVAEHGLERWAYPMFGRSEHVAGVIYDKQAHEDNRRKGLPTNFIWFQETLFAELSDSAWRYIKIGEAQGLHKRYKCRIRTPWYSVPSVYSTPVGMLKRSHHFPRLVLNRTEAFTTDTAYRIRPLNISAGALVLSFVNSLTALTAELEGRHYGGGVLELVPSEIEKLLVPIARYSAKDLEALDRVIRSGSCPEEVLLGQDQRVLVPLGFSRRDCQNLRQAWTRLRSRRQRLCMLGGDVDEE